MRKLISSFAALALSAIFISAENPLVFPDMDKAERLSAEKHSEVTSVRYGDTGYIPSRSFYNLPELEEIIFDGMIGHIDGYMIENCPKLKRVVFNGPILSTGGQIFASNCPNLKEIDVNGLAYHYYLVENPGCESLKGITVNGAILNTCDSVIPTITIAELGRQPELSAQFERLVDWQIKHMADKDFKGYICKSYMADSKAALESIGMMEKASELGLAFDTYRGDFGKTKLQVLKESAPYAPYPGREDLTVRYAAPSDSLLTRTREYFNLDSIAGNGDDISRIKNLLYWVHDLVRHDGGSGWPDCPFNLIDLYNVCRDEGRGLNCRFMAIMLTEALLAEGIPARYLTCQSKEYDTDNDCHVIAVAWSESLGKWVWVDPTFAAYVTDENGLMLHPGEVRYRLQNDLPLVLNEDANWNHEQPQSKEHYLEEYMAKNLYIISTTMIQQSEPEGTKATHPRGNFMALVPDGFYFMGAHHVISDDAVFWAAPSRLPAD